MAQATSLARVEEIFCKKISGSAFKMRIDNVRCITRIGSKQQSAEGAKMATADCDIIVFHVC